MRPTSFKIYPLFKYSVYLLLTVNIYLFFNEEWAATAHRFAEGLSVRDLIEAFPATIDTAAWVILLLMFELETWVLEDEQITPTVQRSLHGLRALCMAFIVYAFYGYLSKLVFLLTAVPLENLGDLCSLVGGDWSYAVDLNEYERITAANCASLGEGALLHWPGINAAVDEAGYQAILRLGWADVINSAVWILVVAVLEIDVRLQERRRLDGLVLVLSTTAKYLFYSILFLAAVFWGFEGDFVEFWDAFLWLVAFAFIEMNVFEWRMESREALAPG